jgi:hypothetical protein
MFARVADARANPPETNPKVVYDDVEYTGARLTIYFQPDTLGSLLTIGDRSSRESRFSFVRLLFCLACVLGSQVIWHPTLSAWFSVGSLLFWVACLSPRIAFGCLACLVERLSLFL